MHAHMHTHTPAFVYLLRIQDPRSSIHTSILNSDSLAVVPIYLVREMIDSKTKIGFSTPAKYRGPGVFLLTCVCVCVCHSESVITRILGAGRKESVLFRSFSQYVESDPLGDIDRNRLACFCFLGAQQNRTHPAFSAAFDPRSGPARGIVQESVSDLAGAVGYSAEAHTKTHTPRARSTHRHTRTREEV